MFNVSEPEEERSSPSFVMVGGKQELSLQLVRIFVFLGDKVEE